MIHMCHGQGCRVLLGMGKIPPLIGIRNPYNWYIKPCYWVDDHPLLYGNNGSLDPSTYNLATSWSPHSCIKRARLLPKKFCQLSKQEQLQQAAKLLIAQMGHGGERRCSFMVVFEGKNNCSQALPKKYRLVKYSYSIVGLLWFIMILCLFSFRSDLHVRYVWRMATGRLRDISVKLITFVSRSN